MSAPARSVLLLLLLISLPAAGCNGRGSTPDGGAAAQATLAPHTSATLEPARDFTLPTLDGDTISLNDLRGGWVLINFWATWCGPCVEEMAYLEQVARTRPIAVLGVNFHEEAVPVQRFVDEHKITFPILMEMDSVTELVYGVRALPRTYLVGPDGMIARQIVGQINPADLDGWLNEQGVIVPE